MRRRHERSADELHRGADTGPLYDATDPTPGGGDTGSVLISPYITPGTVSTTYYNHYSWLRTMEDLFNVSSVRARRPTSPSRPARSAVASTAWATSATRRRSG